MLSLKMAAAMFEIHNTDFDVVCRLRKTSFKMAAAAILEIQLNAIKWAITNPNVMKIGVQTKKSMLSSEVTKTEALVKFQDGLRRHFVN
jgi:hypothetical protein